MKLIKILTYSNMIVWSFTGFVFLVIGLTSSEERSFLGIVIFPIFLSLFLISFKAHKQLRSNIYRSLLYLFIPSLIMLVISLYLLKVIVFQNDAVFINGYFFCFLFLILSRIYIKLAMENKRLILNELMNPKRNNNE